MANPEPLLAALQAAARSPVTLQHPLDKECTFRIGGPAAYFCAPPSAAALQACLRVVRRLEVPYFVLGGGSNVLFKDEGFPGVILSTKQMNSLEFNPDGWVRAGAGLANAALTVATLTRVLTGFEWASGLPGTVGGGVYMNARCYDHAFADFVIEVEALQPDGTPITLPAADCGFAYKDSIFQREDYIITAVALRLVPGDSEAIRALTKKNIEDRRLKGHFLFPSAGCVFKNDYSVGIPSGRLIEACGLKGCQRGDVRILEQHANFIVNTGHGRAQDVLDLIAEIKQAVWDEKKVKLEEELRIVEPGEVPLS